jgi:hypothetical protein
MKVEKHYSLLHSSFYNFVHKTERETASGKCVKSKIVEIPIFDHQYHRIVFSKKQKL